MPATEAQIAANQLNARRSSGPISEFGKSVSRKNGFKHGLSGKGVVVPEEDRAEIDRRIDALTADLKPKTPIGEAMIVQLAMCSFRSERAGQHELMAIARQVRHAIDDFDEQRITAANALFDALNEDPRNNLRRLKKSPEGVDRLIDGWNDLREDLMRESKGSWTAWHLDQAVLMTGKRSETARTTRLGELSQGVWGDFYALAESDGGGLADEARARWCRARIVERVDAEIAALKAHRETLDLESIEVDRQEAPGRALFDPGKEAALARRYEAAAQRGYFKALNEFRRAEADFAARAEEAASLPPPPSWSPSGRELASSGAISATPSIDHVLGLLDRASRSTPDAKPTENVPFTVGRAPKSPG